MSNFYINNDTTIHDEKYEISDQDISRQPDRVPHHTPIDSYIHLVGSDTIRRFDRIQKYNKAFEDCLNQQSALQAWNIKQRQEAPDAPSTLASRNNTKQHNTFKRLLHIPSSLHTTKIHYIDVKKKLNRTSFLFHHRKSDVLTESMVLV